MSDTQLTISINHVEKSYTRIRGLRSIRNQIQTSLRLPRISRRAVDVEEQFQLSVDDLTVSPGEFVSLIGPSGSGKTTLLQLIGGLTAPDAGEVNVGGVPAHMQLGPRRRIRTVFQDLALFPHLSVREQLLLAARSAPSTVKDAEAAVELWMERLELDDCRQQRPHQLSGGQKQRLALGRAMIAEPEVLLLDEPMTALDYRLRWQLWAMVDKLASHRTSTFVVVTHDPDVALSRSSKIVVLSKGKCVQIGSPPQIYRNPLSADVARLLGSANIVKWRDQDVLLRPEGVYVSPRPPLNLAFHDEATLVRTAYKGGMVDYYLLWDGQLLVARHSVKEQSSSAAAATAFFFQKGRVFVGWDDSTVRVLN